LKPTLTCLGFALLLFVYSNCEKSNKTDFENYFKVAEKKIFITSGAMVKLLDNTFLKDMKAVLFASDGISFETKSENTLQIKGKGSLLGFIIHSNQEDALTSGDYFINLRPPFKEGDIAVGFYSMNWDENDNVLFYEKTVGPSLLAGKISVLQKQDLISLSFNFTDDAGNLLTGVYNGTPKKNLIYKTDQIDFED
jgi:hypothetical protein